jgi:small subunit ribosomal protein S1
MNEEMENGNEKDNGENDRDESGEPSFAELLESYESGVTDDLQVGDKIRGKVLSVGRDAVFVDTATKVDGVVDLDELRDEDGETSVKPGDEVELYVVGLDEHEIRLSRAISGIGGLELLQEAFEKKVPVEGRVGSTCKGGFNVEMAGRRAFCPISQIDVQYVETPEDHVGETYEFLIVQLENRGKNVVVSRRKLLAKAMEKAIREFLATLREGDELEGRVTRLMPYGAFVELVPGLEGMVHISELSWSRVDAPGEVVQPDQRIKVKVLGIGDGADKKQKKIALSIKQLEGDPWKTVSDRFRPGEKVSGRVTRCANFGAFVEIAPGIEGLVHISEMSYVKRVVNPEDIVSAGETVSVTVREVDPKKRRISLSLKEAEGDPWLEAADRFPVGKVVRGTVEKKEAFGIFVTLLPGITGLLPKSKIRRAPKAGAVEQLKEGDPIAVTVDEIQTNARKITLAPADEAEEGKWKEFRQNEAAAPMSDLAEKLKQAMEKNKK